MAATLPGTVANRVNRLGLLAALAHISRLAVLLVTTYASALLVFLTQLILVRLLSIAEYGQLAALLAVVNLMTTLSTYGVSPFWLRVFGQEGWGGFQWLRPSLRLLAFTCSTATLTLTIYTFFRFDTANRWAAITLAVPVLLGQVFADTTSARLQLEERFMTLAVWQSLTQTGRFVVVAILLLAGQRDGQNPLVGYAIVGGMLALVGILSLCQMSWGEIVLRGHGPPPASRQQIGPYPSLRRLIREATPFCLFNVFYLLYFQSVVIFLALLVGKPAAAVYNVALQIILAVHTVPYVVFSRYLLGKVFRWAEHDRDKFYAVFHLGVVFMGVLAIALMAMVIAASPVLVPLLFGPAYREAVPILIVLSATIPATFIRNAYGCLFFSQDNIKKLMGYSGIVALFCISLNLAILPAYGLKGATVAQFATEFLLLGLYMRGARRLHKEIRLWDSFRPSTLRRALKAFAAVPTE